MSLFSWLRKLWAGEPRVGRPPGTRGRGPDSTLDYPSLGSVSPPTPPAGAITHTAGTIQLRFGVVSTVGNVREQNEDSYYVPLRKAVQVAGGGADLGRRLNTNAGAGPGADATVSDSRPIGPPGLFVVADGMGGQQAGEQASSMATEHIPRELYSRLGNEAAQEDEKVILRAIREAVALANQEILSLSSLETEFSNMGTTVVLALFQQERVYVTGLGDSRAYRLREGKLEQLTRDHSLADALGEAGTISREEVPTHKFKNMLYLYLGCKDARGGPEDVRVMDVRPGDRFILATDGLTGVVKDDRLAELVQSHEDPQEAAQSLVDLALENHSKDNITCLVIHVNAA